MRKLIAIFALGAATVTLAPAQDNQTTDEKLPFTWWNDVPEMIRRGNEQYGGEKYEESENYYRDARIRKPDEPVAYYNLGLSLAQQNDLEGARNAFRDAMDLSSEDAALREKILYNTGLTHLKEAVTQAEKLKEKPKDTASRVGAVKSAIESIKSFRRAEAIDPNDADTIHNREEAQRLLEYLSQPPPPEDEQQQQQNQEGEGEGGGGGGGSQGEPQDQPQDGDQPQESGEQPQQQPDEQQEEEAGGEKQDEQEQEQQAQPQQPEESENAPPSDGGQSQAEAQGKPQQMTPDEARRMLNLLGDTPNILLRQPRVPPSLRPDPEKDW